MNRRLRMLLVAGGGLLAAVALAIGASAALDRPATTVTNGVTVAGSKAEVWAVLVDLEAYDDWNPVFRNASGGTGEGDRLELDLVLPGHDPVPLDPKVLVSRPDRKLWWQDRLVVPGLRDWEYEVILEPLGNGRVLAVQRLRSEGLLSPLTDDGAAREALELIARALAERVAS
ncbi:MAG TPA: SRPBCC domain-containing protein [Gaiellaceae bacterium]|nr:SRPBCC domain-containing protein [Gaiellaceae bacterium]